MANPAEVATDHSPPAGGHLPPDHHRRWLAPPRTAVFTNVVLSPSSPFGGLDRYRVCSGALWRDTVTSRGFQRPRGGRPGAGSGRSPEVGDGRDGSRLGVGRAPAPRPARAATAGRFGRAARGVRDIRRTAWRRRGMHPAGRLGARPAAFRGPRSGGDSPIAEGVRWSPGTRGGRLRRWSATAAALATQKRLIVQTLAEHPTPPRALTHGSLPPEARFLTHPCGAWAGRN